MFLIFSSSFLIFSSSFLIFSSSFIKTYFNYVDGKERASWNRGLEKALVEVLFEHNNTYHRSQNGWSSETWNMMVGIFNSKYTHVHFTKTQIQNKEKDLKRDYRMLRDARKQSGVGWNE